MAQGICATIILCALVAGAAVSPGCLSSFFGPLPADNPPVAAEIPAPESTTATVHPSEMALAPDNLPADYSLKDRSVIAYDEIGQLDHELGWIQGYRVVYVRLSHGNDDITGIRQVIGIYTPDSINRVFAIDKEALLEQANDTKRYEIAFPKIGDNSIAVRITSPEDPRNLVVYSVLFTKKNICEQITMGGTATDYETLKSLAIQAADKIH
jgi:hypothetical protein